MNYGKIPLLKMMIVGKTHLTTSDFRTHAETGFRGRNGWFFL